MVFDGSQWAAGVFVALCGGQPTTSRSGYSIVRRLLVETTQPLHDRVVHYLSLPILETLDERQQERQTYSCVIIPPALSSP